LKVTFAWYILNVKDITNGRGGEMTNKSPLEALADRIGMYAYLAAVGGLRYWPTVRQAVIEERTLTPDLGAREPSQEHQEKIPA
jgi:hypothetical protein